MRKKRLSELVQRVGLNPIQRGVVDPDITGIQFDSRQVGVGDLFVAIKGHKQDGHQYIADAIERGAAAVVVNEYQSVLAPEIPQVECPDGRKALADLSNVFYDEPTDGLFCVGVTGTKGKSSVAHMSAAVLGADQTLLNSTITNALERGVEQTTPEATVLQRLAREAVDSGRSNFVLEASAHALSQDRVRAVDFDVGVFTNLSHDHFDYFHVWDDYLNAKLLLFKNLGEDSTAVINVDDPVAQAVIDSTSARVLTYSMKQEASLVGRILNMNSHGTHCHVETPMGQMDLELSMPGIFYVENALAVIGVGIAAGLDPQIIRERLESVKHIEGRFERYDSTKGFAIVIDFAHSPDSLERMLTTLSGFYERVITVFGCGGDSDRAKRPEMGRISGIHSAFSIITSDNPKHEDPIEILTSIEAGIKPTGAQYELIEDRRGAIDRAASLAKRGDVLFIAGKGHEQKQAFDGYEVDFNDRDYLVERGLIKIDRESDLEFTSHSS